MLSGSRHVGAYSLKGIVSTSFGENDAYLAVAWPFGVVYKPIRIPIDRISACSTTQWSGDRWDTNLWVGDVGVEISIPDSDRSIVNWCSQRGIKVVSREEQYGWLLGSRAAHR